MVEPYQWLVANARDLGFSPQLCGPASVDLRLGGVLHEAQDEGCFLLSVSFYLASTLEYIRVPHTHAAMIQMRSSWARKGLGHKMAGWIDPGFEGQITLELEPARWIAIPYAEPIVQLIYIRLTAPTVNPYRGKYQQQTGPTESYKVA